MKVVHLSTSDWNGGAAIAANRIVNSQQNLQELKSKLFVLSQKSTNDYTFSDQDSGLKSIFKLYHKFADELAIRLLTVQSRGRYTFPYFGENISKNNLIKDSDIINLHWVNGGFISLKSFKKIAGLNKPIIWTLHDMWAFTGGCHYASDCTKYSFHCSNCPSLLFKSDRDISYKIYNSKLELFQHMNLTFIACSSWLAAEASKSRLLKNKKIFVIPNPIRTDTFKPIDKKTARQNLKLPGDKKLILIGAMNLKDERKGFRFLIEALNTVNELKLSTETELVVFGKLNDESLQKIPVKTHQLGRLKNEDEIIYAYNSADIYVAPSLQDNLPNTVMEAMACGVPVVAFNVGGIPDMIDHNVNGILAKPRSSEELANGIKLLLTDDNLRKTFGINARDKVVKNFDEKIVATKYLDVYKSLI